MAKLRVYQLAKELQVQSALILELLDRMGCEVKSDLSVLDAETADDVRRRLTSAIDAEKRRLAAEAARAPGAAPPAEAEESPPVDDESPAEVAEPDDAVAPTPAPAVAANAPDRAAAPTKREAPAAPVAAARAAARPAAPDRSAPDRSAPAKPAAPGPPGRRKPRVFPARRTVPLTSVKPVPRPAPPPRTAPPPGAGRTMPPAAYRPGGPPRPGASHRPPPGKKRRKKDRERTVVPLPARPKPDLPPVPETITLSEAVTVKELAEKLNRRSKDVIAKLIPKGVLATINQPLEPEMAIEVAKEFGSEATVLTYEQEVQQSAAAPEPAVGAADLPSVEDRPEDMIARPPVVTVMGHVDHGKTSLLDAIRKANVADREAGGITQHIGAYQVEARSRKITFLDTPGHEAFTLIRSRGSKVTDVVVLVVAADDGVKPQTIEAIDHARAAEVPIVVAINKIDKPNSQPDRVKQQLTEHEIVIEEYGGDVVACQISAKKRTGIDELLEMILLVADLKDMKANPKKPGTGVVLETRLDRARGIAATVLVQDGTLRVGDPFIAGAVSGKVRAMTDEHGNRVDEAGPAMPVEIIGFADEPIAGDSFQNVTDEARARQIASFRQEKAKAAAQAGSARRTLESLSREVAEGGIKELGLIVKADSQGSVEALQKSLGDLPQDKIRVRVIRGSIGAISRADILLASASNAIIVGFNVRPDRATAELAREEEVEVRLYTVIYDMLDDVRSAMLGMLDPTEREVVQGQAEVRDLFKVPKIGIIAGCYVTEGKVTRGAEVRLIRDSVVILTGKVGSLRRFKNDVAEVAMGYECGIGIANYNDIKLGDIIEFFVTEKVAAKSL